MFNDLYKHITPIEFGSDSFEEFLTVLGEKIRLKGWERFRGGLDVKGWYDDSYFFGFQFYQNSREICGH